MTRTITWRKWPEEKPTEVSGASHVMIVAVVDNETGRRYTTFDSTIGGRWEYSDRAAPKGVFTVTAWAELPQFPDIDKEDDPL